MDGKCLAFAVGAFVLAYLYEANPALALLALVVVAGAYYYSRRRKVGKRGVEGKSLAALGEAVARNLRANEELMRGSQVVMAALVRALSGGGLPGTAPGALGVPGRGGLRGAEGEPGWRDDREWNDIVFESLAKSIPANGTAWRASRRADGRGREGERAAIEAIFDEDPF
ncbi:MAG: hypothetical protein ACTSU5_18845 [Promethearchaeota archaeon]